MTNYYMTSGMRLLARKLLKLPVAGDQAWNFLWVDCPIKCTIGWRMSTNHIIEETP